MDFLNTYLIYLIPVFGLVGIIVMAIKSAWVTKQETGDASMNQLAGYIADGAMAFLRAEWKVLGYFVVVAGILLAWSGTTVATSSPVIAISFVIGAFLSAFAGYLGMRIATKSNVRTTQAAKTSLAHALKSIVYRRYRYGPWCCRFSYYWFRLVIHRVLHHVCNQQRRKRKRRSYG
jgi:K(+)-stimulated pyrophosphate-energized sodium pump